MSEKIDPQLLGRLSELDFAFQPIVNIYTGNTFGFEALLRRHEEAGFSSIQEVFDHAYHRGILHQVDILLRQKAFLKFSRFNRGKSIKLFYNLDNRLFDSNDYSLNSTGSIEMDTFGLSRDEICFEISEKHRFNYDPEVEKLLSFYRSQGYKIAVDDCGTGFSGLQLLYYAEPDYIKIDRFFIQNMEKDPKKRLVVSTLVNFARFMGSLVLAEGVETRDEYSLCKKIGCDMIQGFFVQRPTVDTDQLKTRYEDIADLSKAERREGMSKDRALIGSEIKYIKPVFSDCDAITMFDKFRGDETASFFPVITRSEEPVGVLRDTAFKEYIFSKFGRQLLENPSFGKDISKFIAKIPIADIHSSIEKLIETYIQFNNSEGMIMVDDMKYVGVLSTNSLLKIINEKNITQARNQNPLTKLPGNTMIHEYFSECLADTTVTYHLVYFDFDNFKPYNDKYGFRNGDRLILMFADLLKKAGFSDSRFVGHIGGDDFFMGIRNGVMADVEEEMRELAMCFKENAQSFYDAQTLENGFMVAKDRDNVERKMPLITVSTAILELPRNQGRNHSIEDAGNFISQLKKEAKKSDTGIASAAITEFSPIEHSGLVTMPI